MNPFGKGKEAARTAEFESILSNAPYLRTYLNSDLKRYNPDQWQRDMNTYGEPIQNYFESRYGKRQYDALSKSHALIAYYSNLFNRHTSTELRIRAVRNLFMFGYELNDPKKISPILKPLIKRGLEEKLINPSPIEYFNSTADNLYGGLIRVGIMLRWNGDNGEDDPQDTPGPGGIEKILSGVDLSGLESLA